MSKRERERKRGEGGICERARARGLCLTNVSCRVGPVPRCRLVSETSLLSDTIEATAATALKKNIIIHWLLEASIPRALVSIKYFINLLLLLLLLNCAR